MIQRRDGTWDYLGSSELLEREKAEADGRKGLNDRQAAVLELVREWWEDGMQRSTAADVAEGLALTGKDAAITALKTLKQLEQKDLLESIQTKRGEQTRGRPPYEYWPVSDASRTPTRPEPDEPAVETAEKAETSLTPEDPMGSDPCSVGVSAVPAVLAGDPGAPLRTRGQPAEPPQGPKAARRAWPLTTWWAVPICNRLRGSLGAASR